MSPKSTDTVSISILTVTVFFLPLFLCNDVNTFKAANHGRAFTIVGDRGCYLYSPRFANSASFCDGEYSIPFARQRSNTAKVYSRPSIILSLIHI